MSSANVDGLPPVKTVSCPNYFKVKESHERPFNENQDDVYHTTSEDNDVALSRENRQFLKIVEEGIHKNALGNWEMPLPSHTEDIVMPNNRLNGLLRTFKRKPEMQSDYLGFMSSMNDCGHAEVVPTEKPVESLNIPTAATAE